MQSRGDKMHKLLYIAAAVGLTILAVCAAVKSIKKRSMKDVICYALIGKA